MLDKDKKSTDIKPTATLKDSNQGTTDKKKDLPVNEPLKKESTPVKPSTQLRRASAAKGHQNGVVLSPVKTGGKENDGNLDNTAIQIPITKESLSVLIESKKDGCSPREHYEPTKIMKLQAEIEDCHKQMTELKNTNSSLQSQLTEAKRKKENLRVQISALEQADKQQKEKEQENLALVARKHQEEMEAVKISYEKKLEEKRLKRQAVKKKLIKKEGQLQDAKKKLTEATEEVDSMVSKAKSDTQLASLVREALEAKLQALTDSKEKECTALLEEIEMLKRNYFLSLGLALKLSKSLMGEHSNQDLDGLYALAIRDRVPHQDWAKWLALKMLRD